MNTARALDYNLITPQVVVLPFGKGKKGKVSNVDQPVRDIVLTDTVVAVPAGARGGLRPPEGYIYTATFLDETKREIYVEINDRGEQYFDFCHFLKEGRKTNLLKEIWELEIIDVKDRPSHQIKERMKKDAITRGGRNAPIPSIG